MLDDVAPVVADRLNPKLLDRENEDVPERDHPGRDVDLRKPALADANLRADVNVVASEPNSDRGVVESIAFNVVGGLGIDTSGYSVPYLASWSWDDADMGIVKACAELIDRHAKRIESAIGDPPNPAAASESAEPRDRRRAASATGA